MGRLTYRKALRTVFKGYIDDSAHKGVFTFSGLLAKAPTWGWLSNDWKASIDEKNVELVQSGRKPISRYHATDCSNRFRDFKDWSRQETDDFTKTLIALLTRPSNFVQVFSFSLRLADLVDVIPETATNPAAFANVLLLMCMMDEISEWITRANKGDVSMIEVALFHERGDYNATLQRAFETERNRLSICKRLFSSLTPMGWEDCVPLQPADLLAYETCKETERDKTLRPDMRKSLEVILGSENFGGICAGFEREGLEKFRDWLTDDLKAQLLLDANLAGR